MGRGSREPGASRIEWGAEMYDSIVSPPHPESPAGLCWRAHNRGLEVVPKLEDQSQRQVPG